jgi:hypothetical protein
MYDVVRLINVLILKFYCVCRIDMQEGKPVIFIGSRSIQKLSPQLMRHMPSSIYYKLTGSK